MNKIRFTKEGLEKLQKGIIELNEKRKAAVEELRKAREMGDLSENGYYKEAKARLSFIDGRLRRFNYQLSQAIVVSAKINEVDIGSKIIVWDGKKKIVYELVGDLESSPSGGKISLLSPIGRALKGKKVNEIVQINVPVGVLTYKILEIKE